MIVEASEWIPDNQWVLDLVQHDPKRYIGLVGSLEIGTPEFSAHLETLSKDERYVGIRLRERPGGDRFFEEEAVWKDLALLAEMDQTLDVLMFQSVWMMWTGWQNDCKLRFSSTTWQEPT